MGFWISLAILLAFYAWARKARAAKDQKGNSLNGSEQQRAIEQTIKIATYNVQTGKSLTGCFVQRVCDGSENTEAMPY